MRIKPPADLQVTCSWVDTTQWYAPDTHRLFYPSRRYAIHMSCWDRQTESYRLVGCDTRRSRKEALLLAEKHCAEPGREARVISCRDGRVVAFYVYRRSRVAAGKFAKLINSLESSGCLVQLERHWNDYVVWCNDLRRVRKLFAQVGWITRFEESTTELRVCVPGFGWRVSLRDGEPESG